MATQVQLLRGTTAQNDAFTGAAGALTYDTDKKQLRIHDGTTAGGASFIDSVVEFQAPTADNNYTWYRKYTSGWVEQGGRTSTSGTQTLPVTMADTNYTVIRTNGNGRSATTANEIYTSVGTRTTTTIDLVLDSDIAPVFWQVSGMAA